LLRRDRTDSKGNWTDQAEWGRGEKVKTSEKAKVRKKIGRGLGVKKAIFPIIGKVTKEKESETEPGELEKSGRPIPRVPKTRGMRGPRRKKDPHPPSNHSYQKTTGLAATRGFYMGAGPVLFRVGPGFKTTGETHTRGGRIPHSVTVE